MVATAAAGELGSVLTGRGDYDAAASYIAQGLTGVPLIRTEVGLMHARLALASGDPHADKVVAEALAGADFMALRASPGCFRLQETLAGRRRSPEAR